MDYYYNEKEESLKDKRRKKDSEDAKEGKSNPYPSYETLLEESREMPSQLVFTIKDMDGQVVRKISKKPKQGIQRLSWDLRFAPKDPINLNKSSFYNPFAGKAEGTLVTPGQYTIEMSKSHNGATTKLAGPVAFNVKALNNTVLPANNRIDKVAFQREVAEFGRRVEGAQSLLSEMRDKMRHIKEAIKLVEQPVDELLDNYYSLKMKIDDVSRVLGGDNIKTRLDIDQPPSPASRLGWINYEQKYSTSTPTGTHRMSLAIAKEEFEPILERIKAMATKEMDALEQKLEDFGAPYTPGRAMKMID
jgi:hypothetical protein